MSRYGEEWVKSVNYWISFKSDSDGYFVKEIDLNAADTDLANVVFPVDSGPKKTTLIQLLECCLRFSSMLNIRKWQ